MGRPLSFTERDQEIFEVLSRRVRVLSLSQIIRTWWGADCSTNESAHQRLSLLCAQGMLASRQVVARQLGRLVSPVAAWQPRMKMPDLGAIAWQLSKRWSIAPTRATIFYATAKCARLFGGRRKGNISRAFQLSHDLGVAEIFLNLRRVRPWLVRRWIDEDRFAPARRREKLPDAVLASSIEAVPDLVLEFAAGYNKSRLQEFHDDNEMRGLAYEIW